MPTKTTNANGSPFLPPATLDPAAASTKDFIAMQPTTFDFQKWLSCTPSLAFLSDTPSVHHSQPPPSSLSMSPPPVTSSNVEAVPPFNGSPSGTSSTLASCGDTAPTPFNPILLTDLSSSLPNPTELPFLSHYTHPMTIHSQNNIFKPKQFHTTIKHPLPDPLEPTNPTTALHVSNWHETMIDKLNSQLEIGYGSLFHLIHQKHCWL